LRKAPENLPEYFRKREERTVNNDRTVKLDGRLFEAPAGLVGMKVILRFENYDRIEVFLDDQSKGFLRDLDQGVNSRIKRDGTRLCRRLRGELFLKSWAQRQVANGYAASSLWIPS
jgi:hypothetical protein